MDHRNVSLVFRLVFILAMLAFGGLFAWQGESAFAGAIVTAAVGFGATMFRDAAARREAEKDDDENP